ncbi:unnamed protein product [Peronospora belbahrii]|uniref:Transcription factor TFIIIC triple barrel domain-containing protein n=1 Tax=Peronospora belbahrii TaxID=622444 RepID=A0AAU9KPZ0_9STRA|nr:unnamed protein product [Peronospora belbahrii]CAH0520714.1 unnamed protein product [Peronospora belbahrii]
MEEHAQSSVTTNRKRQRSRERQDEKEEIQVDSIQVNCMKNEQQMHEQEEKRNSLYSKDESRCETENQDETLVVLELCDFKNHPIFDDYSSAILEGIDTATPMLRIGEYILYGQLEETVGTNYFYDTDTTKALDQTYAFVGQTIKKIKFTIAPPEEV